MMMDGHVLCQERNTCLVALGKCVLETLMKEEVEQLAEIQSVVNGLQVPVLAQVMSTKTEEDCTTIEQVRLRWCSLLDQE